MLEIDLIQTRGFHNTVNKEIIIGFQFNIRLTYYRGIFLSQLRPQKVIVDQMIFPKEQVVWNINGMDYSYEQMKTEGNVHWSPSTIATIKVLKKGGLSQGYHKISTGYKYSSSYMPPKLQKNIDNEEVDPFLTMLFGQQHSTRELLLVR